MKMKQIQPFRRDELLMNFSRGWISWWFSFRLNGCGKKCRKADGQ